MGDKGKKDKGKREQQKKAQLHPKEKRKLKKENKCPMLSSNLKSSIGFGEQAECMIEQDKSDNSRSFWALRCPFWG